MKNHDTIFYAEWNRFLKENNYSSTKDAIEQNEKLYGFSNQPETIARFCSGSRHLSEMHIELFSELFGVRPEYLSGKDAFRTEEDIALYKKKEETIINGLYTIFNNLGYVDLNTDRTDYNQTFPNNTIAFIESLRADLRERNTNLLIDVENNRYVLLSQNNELIFFNEILSFIQYKLGQIFNEYSEEIPRCKTDSGDYLLSPHNEIRLNNEETLSIDFPYVPTARLLNNCDHIATTPDISVKKTRKRNP